MTPIMDTNASYVIANGSDAIPAENDSNSVVCREDTPYSYELLQNQSTAQLTFITILWLCVIINIANFLEEVIFIIRQFQISVRKQKTIYVLGLMPVHAVCAILGVMVPRASILVDLISNTYFGFAVYSWMGLIDNYLGTKKRAQARGVTVISLATPPCCCFCVCLPKYTFNKKTYLRLLIMVYQVTLIRPILAFIASVLWADGQYVPGKFGNNAFTYVSCLNTVSTMFAVWGLIIVQRAFRETLKEFSLFLKFVVLQLTLVGTVLGNTIITILVTKGVIQCTELISTGAKAARMDNAAVVFWMLGLALLGRIAFRRKSDGLCEKSTGAEGSVLPTDNGSTAVVQDLPYNTEPDDVNIMEKESPSDLN